MLVNNYNDSVYHKFGMPTHTEYITHDYTRIEAAPGAQ